MTTPLIEPLDELFAEDDSSVLPFPTLAPAAPTPSQEPEQPKWEYKAVLGVTSEDSIPRINAAGEDGWELVSVVPPQSSTGSTVLYMKRQKRTIDEL